MINTKLVLIFGWLLFIALWAWKSLFLRGGRNYANDRVVAYKNLNFKAISYIVFSAQLVIPILSLFSHSSWLLRFHSSDTTQWIGIIIVYLGLALYLWAQNHLGRNYSPCFDSHLPFEIVESGPYKLIRHPGWLSKVLVMVGTLLFSGSFWFVLAMIWLIIEMKRTISAEEYYLIRENPNYQAYRGRTKKLIPYLL